MYYNNNEGPQLAGLDPDSAAYYSCIVDCNEVNSNISGPPGFVYMTEPNVPVTGNYHIAWDSPCVDGGDSHEYLREFDIDGERRVYGTWVDIGADEAYSCNPPLSEGDIYNALDWNADGVVNYDEYSPFADAWLAHDPNDPDVITDPNFAGNPDYADPNALAHWHSAYNLDATVNTDTEYKIDLADFEVFCTDWLWRACWRYLPDCGDNVNAMDYNGDGLVNLVEFALFAGVWQTNQPGSSIWQFFNLDDSGGSANNIDLADLKILLDDWLWFSCRRAEEFTPFPPVPEAPPVEPTALEQVVELQAAACTLETLWTSDPNIQQVIDPNDWQILMDSVYADIDDLTDQLTESELMALEYIGTDCEEQEQMMSGGGQEIYIESMTMDATFDEYILIENPYGEMSTGELATLVSGIFEVLAAADTALAEGDETVEDWVEIKDFLENVLVEIKASRE